MKRSCSPKCVFGSLAVVCLLAICTTGLGDIVYSDGPSDGLALRDWTSGVFTRTYTDDVVLFAYHDTITARWEMPIFQFPISSFHGWIDVQATMGMFSMGGGGTVTPRYWGGGNGVIQYQQATAGTSVGAFNAATFGWVEFDVSDEIEDAIQNGYDWAVFNVHIPPYAFATISAAEDYDPDIIDWDYRPWLEVTASGAPPEPAALSMLAVGLLALLRRRKRPV